MCVARACCMHSKSRAISPVERSSSKAGVRKRRMRSNLIDLSPTLIKTPELLWREFACPTAPTAYTRVRTAAGLHAAVTNTDSAQCPGQGKASGRNPKVRVSGLGIYFILSPTSTDSSRGLLHALVSSAHLYIYCSMCWPGWCGVHIFTFSPRGMSPKWVEVNRK